LAATLGPTYYLLTALAVLLALWVSTRALRQRPSRSRAADVLRLVMIGAFVVGTCSHVENIWRAGLVPLPLQPLAFNVYWTSLTLLDPLAAFLLLVRPRVGLVLGAVIMVSDVSINAYAFRPRGDFRVEWPFWLQVAFVTLVLAAAPYLRRRLGRQARSAQN
jgi:hypothetical protein